MNMQGAIAALASLNHSQATAAVANTGTAQSASALSGSQEQGFGALLQMLMGASGSDTADAVQGQAKTEMGEEISAQLINLLQQLESDPKLLELAQSGDKTALSSLLLEKGVDLSKVEVDFEESTSLDLMALISELVPALESSPQQAVESVVVDMTELQSVGGAQQFDQSPVLEAGLTRELPVLKDLDPKLQQLIEEKFAQLNLENPVKDPLEQNIPKFAGQNTMMNDVVGDVAKHTVTGGEKNKAEGLLLSQQGMALKQSLNSKAEIKVTPKGAGSELAFANSEKSNMLDGLFSQSVKKSTDEIVSKLANLTSSVTANVEIGDSQIGAVASQVHFDLNSSETSSELMKPISQFSMVGDTVNQVQGLAKDLALQIQAGNNEIRIAIRPEHLGEMAVKVSIDGDTVNLDLKVENAEVKQVFDASIQQLKETLTENGIKVNNLNVDIQQQDMSGQSKSRFFQSSKKNGKADFDDLGIEELAEASVDPNEELQAKLYAHAAYGVNYLA